MSFSIKKFLGLTREPPLTNAEMHLFEQLKANRKIAAMQLIPENLMIHFMTVIFSDRNLISIIKRVYRAKLISDKADLRLAYLLELMHSCLSLNHFGRKLILNYGIDPQDIYEVMLNDTKL